MGYVFLEANQHEVKFADAKRNRLMVISVKDGSFLVKNISKGRKVWNYTEDIEFWLKTNADVRSGKFNEVQ